MRISKVWVRHTVVGLCALIACTSGYFLNLYQKAVPFCLFQILIAVPGLYIGHLAKQHRWLEAKWRFWFLAPIAVCALIVFMRSSISFSYAYLSFPYGIFTYASAALLGLVIVYLFVHINRTYSPIVNLLERIGFYTTYILCLHVIENVGMHWHILPERFPNYTVITTPVIFILRVVFITIGVIIINKFNKAGGWKGIGQKLRKKSA